MPKTGYKFAAFDFDGTIIDTFEGITKSVQYALREEFGIIVDDASQLRGFFGPPLAGSFERLYGFDDEQTARAITKYRERYAVEGIFESEPYKGVREGLERLRAAGIRTAIASSKPISMITRLLEHNSFTELFDAVVGVEGGIKDDLTKTECIELALKRLGCRDKSEACMTGDRYVDAVGAENCGVDFIAAMYGGTDKSEFDKYNVKHFSESFTDVADYILG